jgi:hypothetical protein
MAKTLTLAIAITATLVAAQAFAGGPLSNGDTISVELTVQPGQSRRVEWQPELSHDPENPHTNRWPEFEAFLKYDNSYTVEVEDITFEGVRADTPIPAVYRGYELDVSVERYWRGGRRFRKTEHMAFNPSPGFQLPQTLFFQAYDHRIDTDLWHGDRDYEVKITNTGFNPARIRVTLVHQPNVVR